MFSQADATALRESLPTMAFQGEANRDDALGSGDPASHLAKYISHYGLSFPDQQIQHRLGKFTVPSTRGDGNDHYEVVCQHFQLPEEREMGTAFLLHGYFDHVGLFTHLIRHCLNLNLSVVIFDQPGHGLSSGPVASIENFGRYVDALAACLGLADEQGVAGPWHLIGQSTGCSVILDGLQQEATPLLQRMESFILLAPLLRPHRWGQLRFVFYVLRYVLSRIPRGFPQNSHDDAFLDFLSNHDQLQSRIVAIDWLQSMSDYNLRFAAAPDNDAPLHIIQGSDDSTVDWKYNLPRIVEKFPRAKTYMVTDARHHMVNESAEYRDRIFGIISEIVRAT